MQIILASTSPYRRKILEQLRLPFAAIAPNCDETPYYGENAADTATRLARTKAMSLANRFPAALIIGSDQVAQLNGQQIGKPHSVEHGVEMLTQMSRQTVTYYSALALLNTHTRHLQETIASTEVTLRTITKTSAQHYLSHEPDALNCTGAAKSEGLGSALIEKVVANDPYALIGMPLFDLVTMLMNEGVQIL